MGYMFSNCSALSSLNLNTFNTSTVKNMSCMFDNCYSLKSLNLSIFDTSSVANMSYMFYNCSSLKILNIDQFNVSLAKNLQYMFSECSSLISLNLTNFYSISYSYNFTGMFSNCNQNLKYCINDNLIYNDKFIDALKIFQKNCSDICITMNLK
jgi:surface protein